MNKEPHSAKIQRETAINSLRQNPYEPVFHGAYAPLLEAAAQRSGILSRFAKAFASAVKKGITSMFRPVQRQTRAV